MDDFLQKILKQAEKKNGFYAFMIGFLGISNEDIKRALKSYNEHYDADQIDEKHVIFEKK